MKGHPQLAEHHAARTSLRAAQEPAAQAAEEVAAQAAQAADEVAAQAARVGRR